MYLCSIQGSVRLSHLVRIYRSLRRGRSNDNVGCTRLFHESDADFLRNPVQRLPIHIRLPCHRPRSYFGPVAVLYIGASQDRLPRPYPCLLALWHSRRVHSSGIQAMSSASLSTQTGEYMRTLPGHGYF
jgi:hypothetical protein